MRHILLFLIILGTSSAQAFQVNSSSPSPNSIDADVNSTITIIFDESVDSSTISTDNITVFGRWSGPSNMELDISGSVLTISVEEAFFAGEYVMVGLNSSVQSTGAVSLENGHSFGFWIKTQPGSMDLTDVGHLEVRMSGETFIQCYGAYAGDLDGDGWSDLTVVNENSEDLRVFMNDQGSYSSFTVHDLPLGNKPSSNEGADFNADGEIDLVIGNTQGNMVSIVLGEGGGAFGDEYIYDSDDGVRGVTILDLEGDGDMDIASANRVGNNIMLFINNGNAQFTGGATIGAPLSAETAIISADMNEDGLMDLVVGGYISDNICVFINDGDQSFTAMTPVDSGDAPWMITMGDINLDGHVDIAAASSGDNSISIHFGDGAGGLSELETYPAGGFPLAIDLGDLDGDGDLDVISSNYSGGTYTLYENDGQGGYFDQRTLQAEIAGSCAIFHDRNNDGVMDITGIDELADVLIFFENTPTDIEELQENEVLLYPNPSSADFILEIEAQSVVLELLLRDVVGRLIDQKTVPAGETRIVWSTPELSGEYFIMDKRSSLRIATLIAD